MTVYCNGNTKVWLLLLLLRYNVIFSMNTALNSNSAGDIFECVYIGYIEYI